MRVGGASDRTLRGAAAATRASKSRPSSPASGCHCTASRKRAVRVLHRLERAVRVPGRGPVRRALQRLRPHRLVVVGRDVERLGAEQLGEPSALDGCRVVRGVLARTWGVRVVADDVGQVLLEDAAGRRLPSPACPGRCRAPAGRARPTPGRGRAPRRRGRAAAAARARVRSGAVPARLDVGAPGDDEAVEPVEHGVRHLVVGVRPRRQNDGEGAGALEVRRRTGAAARALRCALHGERSTSST